MNKEDFVKEKLVVCTSCGYNNHKKAADFYGYCRGCGKVINERAYFMYMLKSKIKTRRNGVWVSGTRIHN